MASEDRVPGWVWQEVGDWGEDQVRAILSDAGMTVRGIERDGGEDLMVEPGGREATATGAQPRIGLVQVKGRRTEFEGDSISLSKVPVKRLMRWSTQQNPVLLVFIAGSAGKRTFARTVDNFLATELHGQDVGRLQQAETTIHLPFVRDLAEWTRARLFEFYEGLVPDFSRLSSTQQLDHFEILERHRPTRYLRTTMYVWSVIWKGPRRPAYFAALVAELARRVGAEVGGRRVPATACFHIYRSWADRKYNMAVARVDWFETDHPNIAPELPSRESLRIRPGNESEEQRELFRAQEYTPARFVELARPLMEQLDELCAYVLSKNGRAAWEGEGTADRLRILESAWDELLARSPQELEPLARFVGQYLLELDGYRQWTLDLRGGRPDHRPQEERQSRATLARWTRESRGALEGYCGGPMLLARALGWPGY